VEAGRVLSLEEQYLRVVQSCVKYDVVEQEDGSYTATLITDSGIATRYTAQIAFQYYGQKPGNRLIRAPFPANNTPQEFQVRWDPRLKEIVDRMDLVYMRAYGRPMPTTPLTDAEFAPGMSYTKTRMWYNTHLFSRHVYGRFFGYSPIVHTMEDVSATKLADLFAEFTQNETESREHFEEIKKMLPRAMMLMESMLGMQRQYGSILFRYTPEMLKKFVTNMQSSAGIRPGQVVVREIGGLKIMEVPAGKKFHQFPYYAAEFHKLLQDIWDAEDLYDRYKGDKEYYCIIRLKNEFKVKWLAEIPWDEMEETLGKMRKACREFFIPNMMQQFLSKLLMTPKQLFERGKLIRIGQKWKYGGAQQFAEDHHAGSSNFVHYTGDVRKLDKNIRDYLLSLYVVSGRKYFKTEDFRADAFLDRLFTLLAERINVKMTCHIMGIWTLMKGVMYSGGFETSHGDSWCLGMVFCMFFIKVTLDNPHIASDVISAVCLRFLVLSIYGDDHLMTVPRPLTAWINEVAFAAFAKKYFGMEIRDIESLENFYSEVDSAGELSRRGVVFLKRYFVLMPARPGFPRVYPFKPTHETILKLVCNKENDPRIYPLQAIGQAYDTMGTNIVAYEMVSVFYQEWMAILDFDQESLTLMMDSLDAQTRNRYWRKAGLNWKTSVFCFPTLEHLQSLHKIDEKQRNHVVPRAVIEDFYGVEPTSEEYDVVREWLGEYSDDYFM